MIDKEKLFRAFELMREANIIARQDFSCCQNCGCAEMEGLQEKREKKAIGYAFYHSQDTDDIKRGGNLNITFGTFPESKISEIIIGSIVCGTLATAGLKLEWDFNPRHRITVINPKDE